MDLKKCEMPCSALRIHTANIGSPIGLTRNAMVKRMIPFFGEYVTRTITPRSATMPLTIRNRIAILEEIEPYSFPALKLESNILCMEHRLGYIKTHETR